MHGQARLPSTKVAHLYAQIPRHSILMPYTLLAAAKETSAAHFSIVAVAMEWPAVRQLLQGLVPRSYWTALERHDDGAWTAYTPGLPVDGGEPCRQCSMRSGCLC